ncbi:MAG: hypothetical protein JST50_15140 [Bacteroidetes bacterium]|nr:hypothetical protein [Bacteroidota bacterium]
MLIDSFEKISIYKEYLAGGLFSWNLLRKNSFFTSRPESFRNFIDVIFPARPWFFLIALRIVCCLSLLVLPIASPFLVCSYAGLFIIGSLMNLRNLAYGAETENRFCLIITGALLLRSLAPTDMVTLASLWFIALQACLSYLTAGVSKLMNINWRNGNGFKRIATAYEFTSIKKVNMFFEEHKTLTRLINWLVIVFECAFPIVLFAGRGVLWWFLFAGIILHLAIAIGLRLGKFFWIWVATYPALIYITQR